MHFALVSFVHRDGDAATDTLTEAINADGRFYVTSSEIDGRRFVRISVGSTWTTADDVEALWGLIEASA